MGTISEMNKELDKLERQKCFSDFVKEHAEDKSVIDAYMSVHDMLREAAEEWFDTIKDRKMAVHKTIRKLMHTYW